MVAIDTNVVVYVLTGVAQTAAAASLALDNAASKGGALVMSAPVYAELLALPGWAQTDLDAFIGETGIRVDWDLSRTCWASAGMTYAVYSRRRRRQKAGSPRRILADFIIGAHASTVGALLTADTAFYRTNFPELALLTP